MVKKAYTTPTVIVHGSIEDLTRGSRIAFRDAWFGADGNDGLIGPKCREDWDFLACNPDGS